MTRVLAITRREFLAYFFSPLGYVLIAAFLLVAGLTFYGVCTWLSHPSAPPQATPFVGYHSWLLMMLMFVIPGITMRLLAEELRTGSVELLLTAPVREGEVVLGKFLGALGFYGAMLVSTLGFVGFAARYSEPRLDLGPVAAGYVGLLGIGAMLIAIGLFVSAFCKNQIIAFVFTFMAVLTFFLLPMLGSNLAGAEGLGGAVRDVCLYLAFFEHFGDLGRGIVDLRHLTLYASSTALFLFATTLVLALRKAK